MESLPNLVLPTMQTQSVELACMHVMMHIHCHMLVAASILDRLKAAVSAEV